MTCRDIRRRWENLLKIPSSICTYQWRIYIIQYIAAGGACTWEVPSDLDSTRAYVSGSLWSGFGKGEGTFSDGPYGIQEPARFFDPAFYPYAFNPEVRFPCSFSQTLDVISLPQHARPSHLPPRSVLEASCREGTARTLKSIQGGASHATGLLSV